MKYKTKYRYRILKILMFLARFFYILCSTLFTKNPPINNRFLIESYYRQKLITEINPNKVKYYLPVGKEINGIYKKRFGNSFIYGGDWENTLKFIEGHRKTKDMYELFEAYETGKHYTKTKAYSRHVNELKNNKLNLKNEPPGEVLDSMQKIENYYKDNINLFKEIKDNGFTSQEKVGGIFTREIGIAIGKNGEVYRYGNGYHRMAIAKFLKMEKIPAIIKLVHKDWYEYCSDKYKCDSIEAIKREMELKKKLK